MYTAIPGQSLCEHCGRTASLRWFVFLLLAGCQQALAESTQSLKELLPQQLQGLDVREQLARQLPLELEFTDQTGKLVKLADYFDGERPVLLTLNYYRCPMLCGLTLNALVDGLRDIPWTPGKEFRVLTVSFDASERLEIAKQKRDNYLDYYQRVSAGASRREITRDGWDFLIGQQASIDRVLEATGFPIRWNESRQEWVHPACILVLTPEGEISRYLYGVYYEPQTLRLSLTEASAGQIGSTLDRVLLWCFHYDPNAGSYTFAAMWFARGIAGATLVGLILFLGVQRWRELRRATLLTAAANGK